MNQSPINRTWFTKIVMITSKICKNSVQNSWRLKQNEIVDFQQKWKIQNLMQLKKCYCSSLLIHVTQPDKMSKWRIFGFYIVTYSFGFIYGFTAASILTTCSHVCNFWSEHILIGCHLPLFAIIECT